jgi:hypothetical protein
MESQRMASSLYLKSLKWFADKGPVGWFGGSAPTDQMRRKLLKDGVIYKLPTKNMQMVRYDISATGRSLLEPK